MAVGTPLSAVVAFWLTSPLMYPAMFFITSGTLGWYFELANTIAAIGIGLLGSGVRVIFTNGAVFADPLREKPKVDGCCSGQVTFLRRPQWSFWRKAERIEMFKSMTTENVFFLLKWLALAR